MSREIVWLDPGPHVGFDFGAYRRAAERSQAEWMIFLNHHSRPLVQDWAERLETAAQRPGVGMAGCTGSMEGIEGSPFPNPHIRTNAFCMRRELFLSLDMPKCKTKRDASLLEAGPNSITKQMLTRELAAVIVDSDGSTWQIASAPFALRSRNPFPQTFRWGNQRKLLVADNRTDHYANSMPEERAFLEHLAWGDP